MNINFMDIIFNVLKSIFSILKVPLFIAAGFLCFLFLVFIGHYIYLYIKGYRLKKGNRRHYKRSSFLKRIFIEFPRQFWLDTFNKDPDYFDYQGLHIFCGEQGTGKTMSVVEFIKRIQYEYPDAKCMTNFNYINEDTELKDFREIATFKNGIKGVIVGMDELQNWFSSNESSKFPAEMLETVTQNRKNRRIIIGTSQVFTRLAKPLREQATFIYEPHTFFGCLTIVFKTKPVLDQDGNVLEKKNRGFYFFVHTPELREAYDTYKCIEALVKTGFKPKDATTH